MPPSSDIQLLIRSSGDPLLESRPQTIPALLEKHGSAGLCLFELLRLKNGFYAFSSALHVLPLGAYSTGNLEDWNSESSWRRGYGRSASKLLFFAQDLFGLQFCLQGDKVMLFDPEIGETSSFAKDLDEWARLLLADPDSTVGQRLARAWERENGQIEEGSRLVPRVPFVLGGEYFLENLRPLDSAKAMAFRADLARRIGSVPDGEQVRIRIKS